MADKGSTLNQRVWKLFERAGFQTKPNSANASEEEVSLGNRKRTLDLVAIDKTLGVKIIGWNKARKKLKESFTTHVHDWQRLEKLTKADSVLFVSTEFEWKPVDRTYAESYGMRVWGIDELEYFEALTDTIGPYAKYEIIHYFGITTQEEKYIHHVLALRLHQPFPESETELFLFTLPAEILLKTCVVFRKAQGSKDAYQRILQKKRLGKIKKFVTQPDALLPPSIIVHLGDSVSFEELPTPKKNTSGQTITLTRGKDCQVVLLKIPREYASIELIDGQHRLFGFCQAEPGTRDHFSLVVGGIRNLSTERRTNTFVSINDNARRMDPNLVAYLKLNEDEAVCQKDHELMAIKVVVELNKTSPFKKAIRLLDVGSQRITLKGFAGYDLKGLLGPRGQLRRLYPNESTEYVKSLQIYFGVLRRLFKKQWDDPDNYIIFTNRGISAFLKLLKSILRTCNKRLDETIVKRYAQPLRDTWDDEHWRTENLQNTYVGSQGWKRFHRDLVAVIKKKIPGFVE